MFSDIEFSSKNTELVRILKEKGDKEDTEHFGCFSAFEESIFDCLV